MNICMARAVAARSRLLFKSIPSVAESILNGAGKRIIAVFRKDAAIGVIWGLLMAKTKHTIPRHLHILNYEM